MKNLFAICLWLVAVTCFAANKKTTVTQVTDAVDVTADVDYTVTSKTDPFGAMGSVNIVNTDHAVVILKYFKPSVVIKSYLKFIYINGEAAKNDVNCQVKMYANGSIILPYDKDIKPLTVYSEPNFQGDSSNDFDLRNTGGFMNTLKEAQLNNRIRSFRLKRGYMVTFALGVGGWGYSRCFIADTEDLEMAEMPENMDARVSSYRMFKWNDAKKSGLASDTGAASNAALNASWCYSWGTGENRYPDTECVPNHIYEDWPSASACGGVTYSCHMKTNNEPGNSSDDHPQDVSTVLANWQSLMRTGLRLCSETSHDGSMNHLAQFCDSIDAYGWRCDIVDLHCYWASGTFNSLTWYSDTYGNGRPIWISEWLWGASWNKNGIFGAVSNWDDNSATTQQTNYNGVKPILDVLNSNDRVERYAYWNSERNCSKVYCNGSLTKIGSYYASMEPGIGYKKSNEFIPKVVYYTPTGLTGTYTKSNRTFALRWNDRNGDMLDSMVVECKLPDTNSFTQIAKVALVDMSSKSGAAYAYTDTLKSAGAYYYRVGAYPMGKKSAKYSAEVMVSLGAATGNDIVQYGNLSFGSTDDITTDFETQFDQTPSVFMGLPTNRNTKMYPTNVVSAVSTKNFVYKVLPWQKSGEQTFTTAEDIPFMAIKQGNYAFPSIGTTDSMRVEVGTAKVKADTVEVSFAVPFPEGTVPVVIAELKPSLKSNPILYKVWDITSTGFKATAMYEYETGTLKVAQTLNYMALTPGEALIGEEVMISAGKSTTGVYGVVARQMNFIHTNTDGTVSEDADTLRLRNPYVFGALQTYNLATGTILRKSRDLTDEADETAYTGVFVKRCKDGSAPSSVKDVKANEDFVGWVCLSTPDIAVGVERLEMRDGRYEMGDMRYERGDGVYDLMGRRVSGENLTPGIYIQKGKKILVK